MNFDDQIRRYFGASNLEAVPPAALETGIEHMKVDLGLTKDRGERFRSLGTAALGSTLIWRSFLKPRQTARQRGILWT